jgi:hypothetical protein
MKKTLLTVGIIFTGISLFAQSHHFSPFKKSTLNKEQLLIRSLLKKQAASNETAQKPTEIKQRVIAQTSIDGDIGVQDTATYKYSGTHTSRYNHNSFFEEPSYNWEFQSDYFTGPIADLVTRSFDLQADSIISYDGSTPYSISKAYYRPDNKIDSFFNYDDVGTSLNSRRATKHIFNSTGALQQYTNLSNSNNITVLDTSEYKRLWYNIAGTQLLKDTTYNLNGGNWEASSVTLYFYNTLNNLDSVVEFDEAAGTFQLSNTTKIEYDGNGRLVKLVGNSYDNSGTAEYLTIFSFGYTGPSILFSQFEENDVDLNSNDTFNTAIIKTFGANNLPDTMKYGVYENGVFETDLTFKYFYNSYNNPDSLIAHDIDGEWVGRFNFYYETYDDGNNVGIKNVASNKNFNIYPNPFDSKINIDWRDAKTHAKISLINISGQTIFSVDKDLIPGNNAIELPVLIKGNYLLMIQNEKGETFTSKILKK